MCPGLPEGLPDHVLVGDAVVGQRLAPDGVQRVAQGLSSKFIGLQKKKGRKREAERREGELIRNTLMHTDEVGFLLKALPPSCLRVIDISVMRFNVI